MKRTWGQAAADTLKRGSRAQFDCYHSVVIIVLLNRSQCVVLDHGFQNNATVGIKEQCESKIINSVMFTNVRKRWVQLLEFYGGVGSGLRGFTVSGNIYYNVNQVMGKIIFMCKTK